MQDAFLVKQTSDKVARCDTLLPWKDVTLSPVCFSVKDSEREEAVEGYLSAMTSLLSERR